MEFYGLPLIGQKQIRPMDGAQFHSPWVGEAGGDLHFRGFTVSRRYIGGYGVGAVSLSAGCGWC